MQTKKAFNMFYHFIFLKFSAFLVGIAGADIFIGAGNTNEFAQIVLNVSYKKNESTS